ncbi:MAG: hypothetical protein M3P34_03270, partial [Actinomycetota bacterium]|nr:hypothetical protein [Actinomycetota bacterium]
PQEVAADSALVSQLGEVRLAAARWRQAHRQLSDAQRAFGARVRLDRHTLAGALNIPDRVPLDLDGLVDALAAAEAQRATLSSRLATMMSAYLEGPGHPDVARLARADQERLWEVGNRAIESAVKLEKESLALGGLVTDGEAPAIAQEIESAHTAVEQAQELVEKRRMGVVAAGGAAALGAAAVPLIPLVAPLALAGSAAAAYWAVLGPRQQLAEAQDWETDALIRAGVPNYLSFHLRRMEAVSDPTLRAGLERATREHRAAMADWRLLAGDMSPLEAVEREEEVRTYAAAVAALGELSEDVVETRRRLTERAEPAVEIARAALMDVCRPFGIEHPTLAADLVRQLTEVARVARLQQALEMAEAEEAEARRLVEEHLNRAGHLQGDLAERLSAFEEQAGAAEQRVRDRAMARPVPEVSAEIVRLEKLAESEYRPEFGVAFRPADAREPDPTELQSRRDMTAAAYYMAQQLVPDVGRIADRKSAVERRVAFLEEQFGEHGLPTNEKVNEVERYLQERVAALSHCGAEGESLPLVLDEGFLHLRSDAKWGMLDFLDRLSSQGQVIYLTNDAEVVTWARRRAATGSISLLDPLRYVSA